MSKKDEWTNIKARSSTKRKLRGVSEILGKTFDQTINFLMEDKLKDKKK